MSDIKILHAFGDEPKIDLVKDMHIERGKIYFVTDGEKYTITKTDEQKDNYIKALEELLDKARKQISDICRILYPEENGSDE